MRKYTINPGFNPGWPRRLPLSTSTLPSLGVCDPTFGLRIRETYIPQYAVVLRDSTQVLASAISAGSGSPEVIVKVHTCASIRRCRSLRLGTGALSSRRLLLRRAKFFATLRSATYVFIGNACSGAYFPLIGLRGYVSDNFSVTALLDR